jgi:Cdc6-like AAA superfamily ATPase
MATPTEIATLRQIIDEPDDTNGWTDAILDEIIESTRNEDGTPNYNAAAATAWRRKATSYSKLVDVSESGSSRKMSDLFNNALELAKFYEGKDSEDDEPPITSRPRTRAIVRP